MSKFFYFTLGLAVGFFIDSLRRNKQKHMLPNAAVSDFSQVSEEPLIAVLKEAVMEEEAAMKEHGSPDFLQAIKGIGPAYAQRLFDSGINSLKALANADSEELARVAKVRNPTQVSAWITQAKLAS